MVDRFGRRDALQYGFNEPEEDGFVWSTFVFGLRFEAGARCAVLLMHYPHENGVLLAHNEQTGSRAYHLHSGMNQLVVSYGENDAICHFSLSPRRALPSDVRELGLMLCAIRTISGADQLALDFPEASNGALDSWAPPVHLSPNSMLSRHRPESFIGSGFALACIEPHDGVPRLELALYLSPGERPAPFQLFGF